MVSKKINLRRVIIYKLQYYDIINLIGVRISKSHHGYPIFDETKKAIN